MVKALISGLEIGDRIEKEGELLLTAESPHGDPKVLFENIEDKNRPNWWPSNEVNGFSVSGKIAGPDQKTPLPRAKVKFSCPFQGYINRAKKKATEFQGTRAKPFLLVLDANELGNPFQELGRNLEYYFKKWRHITAVLVFINFYTAKEVGWEFQFFLNPNATRKLDSLGEEKMRDHAIRKRAVKYYA